MACGGLDTLPHNGAVITILAVFGLMHKDGYKHMFATCVVAPLLTMIPAVIMAILLY
jgi:H+/gluconate symporter-like permease